MSYRDDIQAIAVDTSIPFKELSGANILVTGASGLIGACLVKVLLSHPDLDYDVYAMGRDKERMMALFKDYLSSPRLHLIKHDIIDPLDFTIDFSFIIHAASNASPSAFVSQPVEIIKTNILGLCNLLDYGKSHNLKRLLFVSSGEVYGQGDGRAFDEKYSGYVDCTSPRSCYPSAKRAAETLSVSYMQEYGVEVVIARPSHVYGPEFTDSDNRVYAQFIRDVIKGNDIILKSSGSQFRSWCYVTDCVSALLMILLKGTSGEAYNVANPESCVTIRSMAEMIAKIANKSVVFQEPTEEERKGYNAVSTSIFSVSKLKSLGWDENIGLEEGFLHCIEWLQNQ